MYGTEDSKDNWQHISEALANYYDSVSLRIKEELREESIKKAKEDLCQKR